MFDEDPTEFYDVADFGSNWSIDGAPVRGIFDAEFRDALGGASSAPILRVAYTDKPSATGITIFDRDNQRQYKVRVIEQDVVEKEVRLVLEREDSPSSGYGTEFNFNQGWLKGDEGKKQNDHALFYVEATGLYHLIGIYCTITATGSSYFSHYTSPDCRTWTTKGGILIGSNTSGHWRAQVWAPQIILNPNYGVSGAPQASYKYLMFFTGATWKQEEAQTGTSQQTIGLAGCNSDALTSWTILNSDHPIYYSGMDDTPNGGAYSGGAPWTSWGDADWTYASRDPMVWTDGDDWYLMCLARHTNQSYNVLALAKFNGGTEPDFTALTHEASPFFVSTTANPGTDWPFESTYLAHRLLGVSTIWDLYTKGASGTRVQRKTSMLGSWGTTTSSGYALMAAAPPAVGEASEIALTNDDTGDYIVSAHLAASTFYYYKFIEDLVGTYEIGAVDYAVTRDMFGVEGLVGLTAGVMNRDLRWTIMDSEGSSGAFYYQPVFGDQAAAAGYGASGMTGNSYIATHFRHYYPGATGSSADGEEWSDYTRIGWMKSSSWTLTRDRIKMKVGGGNKPFQEFVALVSAVDDRILCIETGNDSHVMADKVWDVESLLGLSVYMVIVDGSTADMGCIALDAVTEYLSSEYADPATASAPYAPGAGPLLEDVLDKVGL